MFKYLTNQFKPEKLYNIVNKSIIYFGFLLYLNTYRQLGHYFIHQVIINKEKPLDYLYTCSCSYFVFIYLFLHGCFAFIYLVWHQNVWYHECFSGTCWSHIDSNYSYYWLFMGKPMWGTF